MAITFLTELALAAYTIWCYKMNEVTRLAVTILICLADFQAAEYMVCDSTDGLFWSRLGYVAIALLPPLGLHLIYAVANAKRRPLLLPAYVSAVGFAVVFLGLSGAFSGHECLGNYVIFQITPGLGGLFGLYYYGWLAATVLVAAQLKQKTQSLSVKRALTWLTVGYAAFIVPTAAANLASPDTVRGIPSVMCGFAVLLAVVIVAGVLPSVGSAKKERM
jgi:hypothetical protein